MQDRVPVLVRIHVIYRLRVPTGSRDTVDRALARHASRCPTAASLKGAVAVTWEATIDDGTERWEAAASRDN